LIHAWMKIGLNKSKINFNPWIKNVAVLDQDQLFVSGDDALGFDPVIRTILADFNSEKEQGFCI